MGALQGLTTGGITLGGTSSGGGGSADSTAGSASGGNTSGQGNEREQYYRIYRAVCQVLGIPLNNKIAAMAFKTRQPGSGFLALVRQLDKNYLRTDDFKNRAADYVAKWAEILPWVKVDYADMKKYVRGEYGNARTEQAIMQTKAFKKAYPYFEYGKDDFRGYIAHEQALGRSLESANLGPLTERRKELFHKLDMTSDEVEQRIEEYISGREAVDLMYGGNDQRPTGNKRIDSYVFNTPGNLARRQVLQQAMKTAEGLSQSQTASAQLRRDPRGRIIQTGL